MKQLRIEIVGVTPPSFVKTTKGGYNILEIAYKSDGKVTGKKILDFVNQASYNILVNAKAGDIFDVEAEKNEKGYFDWTSVVPGSAAVATSGVEASSETSKVPPSRGRVIGNTYETPEERAVKQAAIIRQATINMAIAYANGAPEATLAAICAMARQFEDHVYTDLAARAEALLNIPSDLKK